MINKEGLVERQVSLLLNDSEKQSTIRAKDKIMDLEDILEEEMKDNREIEYHPDERPVDMGDMDVLSAL